MKAEKGKCLVCGDALGEARVWCTDCSTPAHKECFTYNGRCAVYACAGMRFRETPVRSDRGVTWLDIKDDAGDAVPQAYIIDHTSDREKGTMVMSLIGFGLGMGGCAGPEHFSGPYPWSGPLMGLGLVVGTAFGLLRASISDYRVVDGKTRTLYLHKTFLGIPTITPETTFDWCDRLVLSHFTGYDDGSYSRRWTIWLQFKDASALKLTDPDDQSVPAEDTPPSPPPSVEATMKKLKKITRLPVSTVHNYSPQRER